MKTVYNALFVLLLLTVFSGCTIRDSLAKLQTELDNL